jgi:hypothetical protein
MRIGAGGHGILKVASDIFRKSDERAGGRSATLLLGLALAAAIALRLYLVAAADFPIGDGGLFLEFIRGTAGVFPKIPTTVTYNGLAIPFAYPPLSFWTGALLTVLGFDALGVVRVLPILMNIVYALLFALLLLRSGQARIAAALALGFFLVSARSFEWLVMGGGISRGLGSIFLLLALHAIGIPGSERRPPLPARQLVLAGAAVGGAILSHLEWGLLATASVVMALVLGCRTLRDFMRSCIISGATAFILIVPWAATVLGTHGLEPFLAAGQTSQSGLTNSLEQLIWLIRANIFNTFIALGGAALLWRRQFFWIVFFLLCVFVTPRHGPTPVVLPLCVFVGEGVVAAFRLLRLVAPSRVVATGNTGILFAAVLVAQVVHERTERLQIFRPLSAEQRGAMAWVRENHPGARFALSTSPAWQTDSSAEWFPVLAGATNTTTVQGREWLPKGAFRDREEKVLALKASKSCGALLRNLAAFEPPQFIWAEAMAHCFSAPAYTTVFRNADVIIFRRNGTERGGA